MQTDPETCYRALSARDLRFDGLIFVGVTSTGIYCRPICTARTPRQDRCRFFSSAALAEKQGFRPCRRCRPELAPGFAPVDASRSLARTAAARIEAGALTQGRGMEDLARSLSVSSRQLRRVLVSELGVTPLELAQTRRLLLAKQLLTETNLSVMQVAFASGFESVRRFNALFRSHYRITPGSMRRAPARTGGADSIGLSLTYRPPLAWKPLLAFLAARAISGVECVIGNSYLRTVAYGTLTGWLRVTPVAGKHALHVELSTSLVGALPTILGRVRNLFDLDSRPDVIAAHLSRDPLLSRLIRVTPGLRIPGAFGGFETSVRAILGQRISVAAATTIAGRYARTLGQPLTTPWPQLTHLTPTPTQVLEAPVHSLRSLGIPAPRVEAIRQMAAGVAEGTLDFAPGANPDAMLAKLDALPGVGPWTANYIALRALPWPDAFPTGDLVLVRAARAASARELDARAAAWRPWRGYAALHLWNAAPSLLNVGST